MPADPHLAQRYLATPDPTHWAWDEEGTVVAWTSGYTIAFQAELELMLEDLAQEGLRPFGALLLILTACRPGWRTDDSIREILQQLIRPILADDGKSFFSHQWMTQVIDDLDRIHAFPEALRAGIRARTILAAAILEPTEPVGLREESLGIVEAFKHGLPPEMLTLKQDKKEAFNRLLLDMERVRVGMQNLDEEAVLQRARTGLETLPVAPDLTLSFQERAMNLIRDLEEDDEHHGLARLARHLMAAVHRPKPLSDCQELPLGGYSDITNKGALDRLLISELAYDDFTLMTRIALNEALYLRRETPPNNLPRGCHVLIDCGIRLWGVPRVFAVAVGLALAASSDRSRNLSFYRSDPVAIEPVDLSNRPGLMALLEVLDVQSHPGRSLVELWNRYTDEEVLLITHRNAFMDPDYRDMLREHDVGDYHLAAVDETGWFQLLDAGPGGLKAVREARLSLDEILAGKPSTPTSALTNPAEDFAGKPAFLSRDPMPLLLSHPTELDLSVHVPSVGSFFVCKDGRLMHRFDRKKGSREVTNVLPRGKHRLSVSVREDTVQVITLREGRQPRLTLTLYRLETRDVERTVIEHPPPLELRHVEIDAGYLC
ncbi:MAG: hypothetical protein AAF492_10845, partial [Verrucomicrobiota bacterium]